MWVLENLVDYILERYTSNHKNTHTERGPVNSRCAQVNESLRASLPRPPEGSFTSGGSQKKQGNGGGGVCGCILTCSTFMSLPSITAKKPAWDCLRTVLTSFQEGASVLESHSSLPFPAFTLKWIKVTDLLYTMMQRDQGLCTRYII